MQWLDLFVGSVSAGSGLQSAGWILPLSFFMAFGLTFLCVVMLLTRFGARFNTRFIAWIEAEMGRSFLFVSPKRVLALYAASVVVLSGIALGVSGHVGPPVAVATLMAVVPRVVLGFHRARRLHRFREQMPDLVALVAGAMRAGASLNGALVEVARQLPAPAGQEIALVLRHSRLGTSLDEAIGQIKSRMPVEESVLLVSALRIGGRSGGSMAQTLETLAESIRRRLVLEKKIRALTAQGKMQAWVMAVLPFLVLLAMLGIDPQLVDAYFGTTLGWAVLLIVLVLQVFGGWMIRRIVNVEI